MLTQEEIPRKYCIQKVKEKAKNVAAKGSRASLFPRASAASSTPSSPDQLTEDKIKYITIYTYQNIFVCILPK